MGADTGLTCPGRPGQLGRPSGAGTGLMYDLLHGTARQGPTGWSALGRRWALWAGPLGAPCRTHNSTCSADAPQGPRLRPKHSPASQPMPHQPTDLRSHLLPHAAVLRGTCPDPIGKETLSLTTAQPPALSSPALSSGHHGPRPHPICLRASVSAVHTAGRLGAEPYREPAVGEACCEPRMCIHSPALASPRVPIPTFLRLPTVLQTPRLAGSLYDRTRVPTALGVYPRFSCHMAQRPGVP